MTGLDPLCGTLEGQNKMGWEKMGRREDRRQTTILTVGLLENLKTQKSLDIYGLPVRNTLK